MSARVSLLLQPNRPMRLDDAQDAELRVEFGIVWITASGAAGDLFLSAGESYRVPRAGRVLAEAVRGNASLKLMKGKRRSLSALVERCREMLPKGMATP